MAEARASVVGDYVEIGGQAALATQVGAYVEIGSIQVRATALGAYVEIEEIPVVEVFVPQRRPFRKKRPLKVELYDRNKIRVDTPLLITVDRYDADAEGGPASAIIEVRGDGAALDGVRRWIGYYVIIRNGNGTAVWWGKVEDATVGYANFSIGVSLRETRNRIQVLYTYLDADGTPVPVATDWVENARSVAEYGARELRFSVSQASLDQALKVANRLLSKLGLPPQTLKLTETDGAILRCTGLWPALSATYYTNLFGREVFDLVNDAEQIIGWGVTASDIGFADSALHRVAGGLEALREGDHLLISGSVANSGVKSVFSGAAGKVQTYAADTISFSAGDDIFDSADGLGFIEMGTFIQVLGSVANSRYHLVDGTGRGQVTTDTTVSGVIVTELAGPSITIKQGEILPLTATVTTAVPGPSITLSSYSKLAYSFTPSVDGNNWTAAEIWIRLRKVGAPTDGAKISLCANSSGSPGTVLDSATVSGSSMVERSGWVKFTMSNTTALVYGNTYWLVFERTGSTSDVNYYSVGLDETQSHTGTLKLYINGTWVSRATPASMPFQVWGQTPTTTQLNEVLIDTGQFNGVDVRVNSGVYRRQYRDGSEDALFVLTELIDAGDSSGNQLIPMVTVDWRAVVDVAPSDALPPYTLRGNKLITSGGQPAEDGLLPVGQWCAVDGIISEGDALAPVSPFMIGYLEYNAAKGRISDIRPYGMDNIYDFSNILQG